MFKLLFALTAILTGIVAHEAAFANCCEGACYRVVDLEVGWRRDYINWKTKDLCSGYLSGNIDDKLFFKDINSYTISGHAKWLAEHYYIRTSAEYGLTDKGRAHEHFDFRNCNLCWPLNLHTSDPIKRRSEVYDFDGAIGYPFLFYKCHLCIIPLLGFSFHRQHLRVKESKDSSSCCDTPTNPCQFFQCHSSSSFFIDSCNDLRCDWCSNPFASESSSNIARNIGLINFHRTDTYRITWYGFYMGADMSYACDGNWTLYWNTEFHFLDSCHRKRKSFTGVFCVDDYHRTGGAYGFNNIVGFYGYIANNWYFTGSVDFNWWRAKSRHDEMVWKKVGAKLGLAYQF